MKNEESLWENTTKVTYDEARDQARFNKKEPKWGPSGMKAWWHPVLDGFCWKRTNYYVPCTGETMKGWWFEDEQS